MQINAFCDSAPLFYKYLSYRNVRNLLYGRLKQKPLILNRKPADTAALLHDVHHAFYAEAVSLLT